MVEFIETSKNKYIEIRKPYEKESNQKENDSRLSKEKDD